MGWFRFPPVRAWLLAGLLLAAGRLGGPQRALATPFALNDDANPCRAAAAAAERTWSIPAHLLAAIARVETGRADRGGERSPWPWSVNAEGAGSFYDSKEAAIAAVRQMQSQGIRSIDVGCLQVNLMHHPDAFGSLEDAFNPATNANYAARFLTALREQTGSWPAAAAAYHSMTPDLGRTYLRQVLEAWPLEALGGGLAMLGGDRPRPTSGQPHAAAAERPVEGAQAGGAIMLSNGADRSRLLPAPASAPPGRSLDAYRSMPILAANRPGYIKS
jgi:hypothetical protein